MTTDRTDFKDTWLSESPQRIGKADYYPTIVLDIRDYEKEKAAVLISMYKDFSFKKIKMETLIYYWLEKNGIIILAVELGIKPQGLVVHLLGKNPDYKNISPFASQLYSLILQDNKHGIRIMSDVALSDEGYKMWKRLYMDGHTVTVYNIERPGGSYITLRSFSDFDNFFGSGPEYKKYQFILNENSFLCETRAYFNLRRIRELSGMDVDDSN